MGMLRRWIVAAALIAAGALLGGGAVAEDASPENIRKFLEGNTLSGHNPQTNNEFVVFHEAGGKTRLYVRGNFGQMRDFGTWELEAPNKICIRHPKVNNNEKLCSTVHTITAEEMTYTTPTGVRITAKILKGNSGSL
jgi:hypothetical protein